MELGTILLKNTKIVIDMLEYAFDTNAQKGIQKKHICILTEDLDKSKITKLDFERALLFLKDQFPDIKICPREYDTNKFYLTAGMERIDPKSYFLTELDVPSDFKALLKKIRAEFSMTPSKFSLADVKISFNKSTSTLMIGDNPCSLTPHTNQSELCEILFLHDAGVPIDWVVIAEKLTGLTFEKMEPVKKYRKLVQDAAYAINDEVEKLGTDDRLFRFQAKSLIRQY